MSVFGHIFKGFLRLAGRLPLRVHYAFGTFVAFLAEKVLHYRTADVMINLSRSFPEMKYDDLKELSHSFYRHFGDIIAETIWFGACRSRERLVRQNICEIVNPEVLQRSFDNSPSVMVMYSHCGNWELFGGMLYYNNTEHPFTVKEDDICVVYKRLSSSMWDWIMKDNRCAPLEKRDTFEGYVESNDMMRFALRHRGRKMVYNINTDQSPYYNAAGTVDVDFLHQPTRSMTGAATLANRLGFSVLYLNMLPVSRGHYLIEFTPICDDASKVSPEEIVGQYYRLLEKDINAMPHNYLWSHRRWKIEIEK